MKFKYVIPTLEYKEKAFEYIKEFIEYKSDVNGAGSLDRYLDNYEGWLEYREESRNHPITDARVPGEEYFMVNEDDEIIGMCNIRFALNDKLKKLGGHIGYSIRPTERKKGYNKINLYLVLQEAKENNLEKVLITCADSNDGSRKTILSLGGKFEKSNFDESDNETMELYWINVNESIEKHKDLYEPYISKNRVK